MPIRILSRARVEVLHAHVLRVLARGEQRRFVDEVGEVGAAEARRAAGDGHRLDVVGQRHPAHVHAQDLLAAPHVGQADDDLAVEAARAQQRRVEHVGAVGRGDHDHAFAAFEPVHLDEQLVERLLALVVPAAEAGAAMAADRVDFVDEDDARRVLLGLLEHVAHAAGADADEHLDEVGTGDREERHLRFAGDRLGEQRLAGARRADHQHAARDLAAELLELAGVAQELDELGHFLLRFVATGDVGEGDLGLVFVEQLGARTAEGHRALAAALLHLPHEVDPDADEQQQRAEVDQDAEQRDAARRRRLLDLDLVVDQVVDQALVAARGDRWCPSVPSLRSNLIVFSSSAMSTLLDRSLTTSDWNWE